MADPSTLPAVVRALKDRESTVRCEVILAVVKNGQAAGTAIPVLTELQQHDPDAQVRSYAARAVEKLQRGTGGLGFARSQMQGTVFSMITVPCTRNLPLDSPLRKIRP